MRSTLLALSVFLSCFLFWSCTKSDTDDTTPGPPAPSEYMKYTVNGTAYELGVPTDTFSVFKYPGLGNYIITCKQANKKSDIYMQVVANAKGEAPINALYLTIGSNMYMQNNPGDNKVTITELGTAVGEFIGGSFSGQFNGPNGKVTIACSFRCKLRP